MKHHIPTPPATVQASAHTLTRTERSVSKAAMRPAVFAAPASVPVAQTAAGLQPIQRFADDNEAAEKGTEFRTLSDQEFALNGEITNLVQAFQLNPTDPNHQAMMVEIENRRLAIKAFHDQLALIVTNYEAAPGGQQKAFFDAYLSDKALQFGGGPHANLGDGDLNYDQIRALFNSLAAKTIANTRPDVDEFDQDIDVPLTAERSRFLLYVMQGLHDAIGVDQYRNLDRNLGPNRQIRIDRTGPNNQSGGLANFGDQQHANKTDDGAVAGDAQHLIDGGGSGIGYLGEKFAGPYARGQNPNRAQIGNVQVNMDRDDELMPIFTGMDQGEMRLFSPPKKMAVHHEIGHVNSMLEGKSGEGKPMTGALSNLTDQEEMYNIWGGPRSDRAYGEELGLPQRFDHKSLVTYYGAGGGSHDDFIDALKKGTSFTSTDQEVTTLMATELRRLVDSNWGKITKGIWSKPDGVKEIVKLLDEAPQGLPDLTELRDTAVRNRDTVSGKRHPFTQDFYRAVANINPASKESVSGVYLNLKQLVVPQQWD